MRIYSGDVRDGYFAKSLSECGADNARTDLNSVLVSVQLRAQTETYNEDVHIWGKWFVCRRRHCCGVTMRDG